MHTELGVDVIPANILLAEAKIPISGIHRREIILRRAIASPRNSKCSGDSL
ncbi:MAG: hypothetical protein F6K10_11685 [Moorea sp. SIO2B7]|nr:hypothetical protein [Moorena sp. SIO2B7]